MVKNKENMMGRLSQLFWALQAEDMPSMAEANQRYSHLDVTTQDSRKEMAKLRREYRKSLALEDAAVLKGK